MRESKIISIVVWMTTFSTIAPTFAFTPSKQTRVPCRISAGKENPSADINPVAKASWYAVEVFGKVFADSDKKTTKIDQTRPPSSPTETLQRIKDDNDRSYFLSGNVDSLIYDEDCIFSDPFVAFSGRDRFVENLQNLGSFITNYDAKLLDYTVSDNGLIVDTKVRSAQRQAPERMIHFKAVQDVIIVVSSLRSFVGNGEIAIELPVEANFGVALGCKI